MSDWIFIHLNIQRLNIGGFTGDEMDLPDNLDSFHPSRSEFEQLGSKSANKHKNGVQIWK